MGQPEGKGERLLVWGLSPAGVELARRLGRSLQAEVRVPERFASPEETGFASLAESLRKDFREACGHVVVAATGVVVRAVAPVLESKFADPAVVVCDPAGKFAVSLLSGHIGGANELARRAAEALGAQPVVTTASDACGLPAVDELARAGGLDVSEPMAARRIACALLEGRTVQLYDPEELLGLPVEQRAAHFAVLSGPEQWDPKRPGVWVHWSGPGDLGEGIALRPKRLFAGIGCRRGASKGDILAALDAALEGHGGGLRLARESLAGLASIDLKRSEPGLLEAAGELGLALQFFTAETLDKVPNAQPSALVKRHTGTKSVCEAAAILASRGGMLLAAKTIRGPATAAVAVSSR
jgi:cobalamin biosynthesis protein CbiG